MRSPIGSSRYWRLQLRRESEEVEGWKAVAGVDAVPEVAGQPEIAGPERELPLTVSGLAPLPLFDRVHCEAPCAVQPQLVSGSRVQLEQCVAAARRAMTETRQLGERSGRPGQLSGSCEQSVGFRVGRQHRHRVYDARR